MAVPQIQLRSTPAQLGLSIDRSQQTIRQPKPEQTIRQPDPVLSIRQRPGRLTIGQTKAWQNVDMKSIAVRTKETAQAAERSWLEGLTRRAADGDELMRIETGGQPLANQAIRNSHLKFDLELAGRPVYELVDVHYERGGADRAVERRAPIIETLKQKPVMLLKPGKVTAYMVQYPQLQMDWSV